MSDYTDTILAVGAGEDIHSPVSDTEEAIIVNADTRDFTFGEAFNKTIGVAGDRNSEVVSFAIDRYIDNHDISECAEHIVFWRNLNTSKDGKCTIKDIKISETNENTVLLGWLIDEDVAESPGEIEFALEISDYDASGKPVYEWNTKKGSGLLIEEGFDKPSGGSGDGDEDDDDGETGSVGVIISDTPPTATNVIWFNTAGTPSVTRLLDLTDEEEEVSVETEAGTYGVRNIVESDTPDTPEYDYTII